MYSGFIFSFKIIQYYYGENTSVHGHRKAIATEAYIQPKGDYREEENRCIHKSIQGERLENHHKIVQ